MQLALFETETLVSMCRDAKRVAASAINGPEVGRSALDAMQEIVAELRARGADVGEFVL